VQVVGLVERRGLERLAVPAQVRGLVERLAREGIGEDERVIVGLARGLWSRSSSPASRSAIGTLRVALRDFGVSYSPRT
jgi:hypothetical protein